MSSPRHSPPPSAAAPKPKGILKNANTASSTAPESEHKALSSGEISQSDEEHNRLAWDEGNLTLHEIQRQQQDPRMKIDEPKTPFVRSASLGPMTDEDAFFNLDVQQQNDDTRINDDKDVSPGYVQPPSSEHQMLASSLEPESSSSARRSSAAEVLAANTKANAAPFGLDNRAVSTGETNVVPLDEVQLGKARRGAESRSPSFTLPSSRRDSAVNDRSRDKVREELRSRTHNSVDSMDGIEAADSQGVAEPAALYDSDGEEIDREAKAKQDEFARKRNAHYGKEADAMRIAAALAAQEDEEDEEDEEEGTDVVMDSGKDANKAGDTVIPDQASSALLNGRPY